MKRRVASLMRGQWLKRNSFEFQTAQNMSCNARLGPPACVRSVSAKAVFSESDGSRERLAARNRHRCTLRRVSCAALSAPRDDTARASCGMGRKAISCHFDDDTLRWSVGEGLPSLAHRFPRAFQSCKRMGGRTISSITSVRRDTKRSGVRALRCPCGE